MPAQRTTPEQRLQRRIRQLEILLDAYPAFLNHADPAYLEEFAALTHAAHNGIRKPDDLGGNVNSGHASSRPPHHDTIAYAQLRVELSHQSARAQTIRASLHDIDGTPTMRKARGRRLGAA